MRHVAAGVCLALLLAGCAVSIDGEPIGLEDGPSRGAARSAPALPFVPEFSGRTNNRNDGSSFEPCTAYTSAELRAFGADPTTIQDAAFSESPNFRGCSWTSTDRIIRLSQVVSNQGTLAEYKVKQGRRPWQADLPIAGRTVAVAPERPEGCMSVFESGTALIITAIRVAEGGSPSTGLKTECDTVVAWATLAIAKAP